MFELEDFYVYLAKKYNLKLSQVEEICRTQFKWLSENISSGEYKPVKLMKIGKFVPVPYRIKLIQERRESKLKHNNGLQIKGEGENESQGSINEENI